MSEGDQLLAAVLANPEDNAPRLIYADWLEEHGQEKKAWPIRQQLGPPTSWPNWVGKPYYAVLFSNSDRELRCPDWCVSAIWERGFIRQVVCAATDWIQHADAFVAQHPVEDVQLITPLPMGATIAWLKNRWPSVKKWGGWVQ